MIDWYVLYTNDMYDCFYDLSNGSLDDKKIGEYDGFPIYSAEKLLLDIEGEERSIIRKIVVIKSQIKWEE